MSFQCRTRRQFRSKGSSYCTVQWYSWQSIRLYPRLNKQTRQYHVSGPWLRHRPLHHSLVVSTDDECIPGGSLTDSLIIWPLPKLAFKLCLRVYCLEPTANFFLGLLYLNSSVLVLSLLLYFSIKKKKILVICICYYYYLLLFFFIIWHYFKLEIRTS